MKRQVVTSSNICSIGYDLMTKTLEIEFKDGSIYDYINVPPEIFSGLMSASSHGKYLNQYIKSVFQFVKI